MPLTRRLLHSARCAAGSAGMSAAIFAGLFIAASAVITFGSAVMSPPLFGIGMFALAVGATYVQGKLGAKATLWATNRLNKRITEYPAPQPQPPVLAKKHQKAPQVQESLGLKIVRALAKPVEWIVGKAFHPTTHDPENPKPYPPVPSGTSAQHSTAPTAYTTPSKPRLASFNIPKPILTGLRLISTGVSKLVPSFMHRSSKDHSKGGRGDAAV